MEALIKKYFWTVNLIFIALGAFLIACMVNVVVAHKLRTIPTISNKVQNTKPTHVVKNQVQSNQMIVDRNYFGSAMSLAFETVEGGAQLDEDRAGALLEGEGIETTLHASLVGTIVASDPSWSMALITDQTKAEMNVFRVKDTVMDEAEVLAILSTRVYLNHNGVFEYINLQEKAGPKGPKPPTLTPQTMSSVSGEAGEGIKKVGEDSWAIERGEIDKTLSNLNNIAMQARIVPSFQNGESNGFKLFAIRPGSLYSKLGIQNGDIIHKINGFPINSPDKALEVYQKLKNAQSVDIELTRRGQVKKLNYRIE